MFCVCKNCYILRACVAEILCSETERLNITIRVESVLLLKACVL